MKTEKMDKFEVCSGSVIGKNHTRVSKNNQDAFWVESIPHRIVAVVSDGCGSAPHSEAGSKIGSRLVAKTLLETENQNLENPEFWSTLRQNLLIQLQKLAQNMGQDIENIIYEYFLFTLLGTVIDKEKTVIFGIGDGVFALNNKVTILGPYPDNAPPYLSYGLIKNLNMDSEFKIHEVADTQDLESLFLGTDGISDFIDVENNKLPLKEGLVGNINQFWKENRYFKNPDAVRRKLALLNRKDAGMLRDDATLVTIRRKRKEVENDDGNLS